MGLSIAKRHQLIISKLNKEGYVNVSELSRELEVSTVTIRKDLKFLEDKKLLFRSHGSATPQNPYIADRHVNEKEKMQVAQKQSIALKAISFIDPNDSIILASGTTINEFSQHVQPLDGLTVICSSLIASRNLTVKGDIDVIQLGGLVRKSSSSVIGPHAERMLEGFTCNKLFIGVDGIDPEYGFTTTNAMEASLNQKMIEAAQKVIVLADSTKFARRGFGKICDTGRVDMVITDKDAPQLVVNRLREKGVEITVV
jgi:DeoR family transcriptional regulator of aga operon